MKNHRFLSEIREESLEIERLLTLCNIKAESKLLDFGCGPGLFMDYYIANGVMDVVGYDINEEFIEYCQNNYPMYLFTNVLPNDRYDHIILSNVYHHLENSKEVIAKLLEMLHKDGLITIIEFKKQEVKSFGPSIEHKIDINELKVELEEYNLVKEIDFNEYYYILQYSM